MCPTEQHYSAQSWKVPSQFRIILWNYKAIIVTPHSGWLDVIFQHIFQFIMTLIFIVQIYDCHLHDIFQMPKHNSLRPETKWQPFSRQHIQTHLLVFHWSLYLRVQLTIGAGPGNKPLSEPMMVRLLTHKCVTRPQWVKDLYKMAHVGVWWLQINTLEPT